jgi:hypothetical protein
MAFNKDDWKTPAPFHGMGWMYLAVHFIAFLFFFFAAFTCWLTVSQKTDFKVLIGYWSRELPEYAEAAAAAGRNRNYCVSWDSATKEDLFDGSWRFGKTVGVVGALLVIPTFLISICVLFQRSSVVHRYFIFLTCMHITMALLSLLLLSGLASDVCEVESCRLGPGGYLAIVDMFLWAGAAIMAFLLGVRSRETESSKASEQKNRDATPRLIVEKRDPIIVAVKSDPSVSETEKEEAVTIAPKSPPKKKKRSSTNQVEEP